VTTDPKVDFKQDIGSMDPAEAHDAWEEMTNLDAPALRETNYSSTRTPESHFCRTKSPAYTRTR